MPPRRQCDECVPQRKARAERVKAFALGCVWTSGFPWCLTARVACSRPTVAVNLGMLQCREGKMSLRGD